DNARDQLSGGIVVKERSISRRSFAQLFGAGAALAATRPSFAIAGNPLLAALASTGNGGEPVRLNSNENPYGPSPMALKAMTDAFGLAWRYPDEHADALVDLLAKINGVAPEQIMLGDGSGETLKVCASAFTGSMLTGRRPVELSKPTRGPALTFVPGRGKLVVA